MTKRERLTLIAINGILVVLLSLVIILPLSSLAAKSHKKVVVLGFDGMDPQICEGLFKRNLLPTLRKLRDEGTFMSLGTSIPPQSPVAWANFITGLDPGGHGIFDFIHREPDTMLPFFSTSKAVDGKELFSFGDWIIPRSGEVKNLLKGKAFWQYLGEAGIPHVIYRIPSNFPPVESKNGKSISGMGTPDMLGSYGTFYYFTDNPPDDDDLSGGEIYPVDVINNVVDAELVGPTNPFRKPVAKPGRSTKQKVKAKIPFKVYIDPENNAAKLEIQDNEFILKQGEWSDWKEVNFEMVPYLVETSGIALFYLQEVRPDFKLYVSPIQINPASPALPNTAPPEWSQELHENLGYFFTQGMAEDHKALSDGIFDETEFLQQAKIVLDERQKQLDYILSQYEDGFLFFYFSSSDMVMHMIWHLFDPQHPLYDAKLSAKHEGIVELVYGALDSALKKVIDKVGDDATIIVMSDHGFSPFYRAVNINTWLLDNGYVTLEDPSLQGEYDYFMNVDWSRTRAYGLGLNGIYVNQRGREKNGIVEPGFQTDRLVDEIAKGLLELTDPERGNAKVIKEVYKTREVYKGKELEYAPDLIVGFARGYRASWDTPLGKFPYDLIVDNDEKWSSDHCVATSEVPGILITNRKVKHPTPKLYDLPVTILNEFGIAKPPQMLGTNIFESQKQINDKLKRLGTLGYQ